jgi:hypothetical protein
MKPALWQAPDEALMSLRNLGRQINRLTATRTQAKNRLHALRSKSTTLPVSGLVSDSMFLLTRTCFFALLGFTGPDF